MTPDEIRETGCMGGMSLKEITDFMDREFYMILLNAIDAGENSTKLFAATAKLRWLTHHAIMYAHSDGLFEKHMARAEKKDA